MMRSTSTPWGPSEFPTRPPPGTSAAVFSELADVITLMEIFNRVRLRVWAQQPSEFFDEAIVIVDADGTIVPSGDAECKQGMDFAYNGQVRLPSALDLAGQYG